MPTNTDPFAVMNMLASASGDAGYWEARAKILQGALLRLSSPTWIGDVREAALAVDLGADERVIEAAQDEVREMVRIAREAIRNLPPEASTTPSPDGKEE